MDPITLAIVSALAAGATKVAEQSIVDGYNALKSLLKRNFGSESQLVKQVENLEAKPESKNRQESLQEEVKDSRADQDQDVLASADKLLALLKTQPGVKISYQAELKGSGAIAQGSGAKAVGAGGVMIEGDVQGGIHTTPPENDEE